MPAEAVQLVFGNDDYLVSSKARDLVNKLVPKEEQVLSLDIVEGGVDTVDQAVEALGKCLEALRTVGFFSQSQTIWFKDVSFLGDTRTGRSEVVKTRLGELAELIKAGLPEGQTLIISARQVDKRFGFYKACKSAGTLFEFSLSEKSYQSDRQARDRVRELLPKFGLEMDAATVDAFIGRVGAGTRELVGELEKLSLYKGGNGRVSVKDIEAVTCASRGAVRWDLADAIGERDVPRALMLVRQLLFQKENPIGLIIGIEARIRELSLYREAITNRWMVKKGRGAGWGDVPPEVDSAFKEYFDRDPRSTHPFRIGVLAQQAANFTRGELYRAEKAVAAAHEKLVSSSIPNELILEFLIMRVLKSRRAKRKRA